MDAGLIWNDHTARVLLADLYRSRKDDKLGPMRLQAFLDYVGKEPEVARGLPKAYKEAVARTARAVEPRQPGLVLEEGEPIAPGYVEAQRKLRGDPEAALRRTADVVKAAVSGGQAWGPDGTMEIIIPRDYVTSGLKELLKQGANLEAAANLGITALKASRQQNQDAVLRFLLAREAKE